MSALAKMVADMVLKELPQEVRDAMTPENFQIVFNKLSIFVESIPVIATEQVEQRKMIEEILERLPNDSGSKRGRKPTLAIADGAGNGERNGTSG
jgi:CO dehydrogenase/acetyl-CoA synthase beta subunit